ncbi:DUF397 domain-containing protein [Streptomyces niveiscabiei]|uniref:DUF397 domain-containing protein n=1 Tax=Streptomyces niveiscabiei TaxID=164115 RepID=UPI0029BCCF48|nr:DUF397 domain-containing protein [Streptomyces niveiscabiei]MDX3383609.1 DUF397 domain-containing protein [Streptomyces niveiscabiei]
MAPNWRTSSYTGKENCVEVADNNPEKVMVRDTKNHGGGILGFQLITWGTFVKFMALKNL